MLAQEGLDEAADLSGRAGVQFVAKRDEAIPLRPVEAHDELAVLFGLFRRRVLDHGLEPILRNAMRFNV